MFTLPARVPLLAAASAATLIILTGCSDKEVLKTEDLEEEVTSFLEREAGLTNEEIADVDCPDELDREDDASVRCTVTGHDGSALGATVSVTDADDGTVRVQMDDEFLTPPDAEDPAAQDQATAEDPAAPQDPAAADPQAGIDTGASGGVETLAASEVEQEIASAEQAQNGAAPQNVSCPSDISAVVGGSMTCTMIDASGVEHDAFFEITSIDGGVVNFDISVDPA